jgi:hypothetical protein
LTKAACCSSYLSDFERRDVGGCGRLLRQDRAGEHDVDREHDVDVRSTLLDFGP